MENMWDSLRSSKKKLGALEKDEKLPAEVPNTEG